MKIFISGTDTDVGKTIISSWLCLHSGYDYFKPVQTGNLDIVDSETVKELSGSKIFPESYSYTLPASPHIAAAKEGEEIDLTKIMLPESERLIIEGAGGLMVPLNEKDLVIDLINQLQVPVILVIHPKLGAINHSLLSIEALRQRNIKILGVIFSGNIYPGSEDVIKFAGVDLLAHLPKMNNINRQALLDIPLSDKLENILGA